jgi:Dimerisation domain
MFSSTIPSVKVVRSIEVVRDQIARLHRSMMPAAAVMMELVTGAWVAQAIVAAADLGIADALADGPLSADELATAVNAEADTINRLLRALITRGIFRQHRDGRYDLTPLADSLRSDAEVSLAAFARFVGSPQHREHWSHLTDAIRTGRAVIPALRGNPHSSTCTKNRNSPKSSTTP